MKTFKNILFIFTMLFFFVQTVSAQDYKHPFNVQSNGQIVNQQGIKLGWIESDGTIKNSKGDVVGKIQPGKSGHDFSDKAGKQIGKVSQDGSLQDRKGKVLFTVSTPDENGMCNILNPAGKVVGTVHENYKQQGACAIHCLKK